MGEGGVDRGQVKREGVIKGGQGRSEVLGGVCLSSSVCPGRAGLQAG